MWTPSVDTSPLASHTTVASITPLQYRAMNPYRDDGGAVGLDVGAGSDCIQVWRSIRDLHPCTLVLSATLLNHHAHVICPACALGHLAAHDGGEAGGRHSARLTINQDSHICPVGVKVEARNGDGRGTGGAETRGWGDGGDGWVAIDQVGGAGGNHALEGHPDLVPARLVAGGPALDLW